MKSKSNLLLIIVLSVLLFGGLIAIATLAKKKDPGVDYSEFIGCLAEKQAKFYGASWCPHCKNQKARFGSSADVLSQKGVYVECSPDGSSAQTQQCIDAKIESYPTWEINGERIAGELELKDLAEKTSCTLPETK
jgi:hypothetical protein